MLIGPFSLMTKLLADPIIAVAMAGMGLSADEDDNVKLAERALLLAEQVISRSLAAQMEAGAKAVLSTLWSVDDEATQAFMDRFYNLYLGGMPPQQALRTVHREFIADPRWSHPYYWAPFVMVGVE